MFHLSTQNKNWIFDVEELKEMRTRANRDFVARQVKHWSENENEFDFGQFFEKNNEYLTVEEEAMAIRYYELQLKNFCEKFDPRLSTMDIVRSKNQQNSNLRKFFSFRQSALNISNDFTWTILWWIIIRETFSKRKIRPEKSSIILVFL